MFGLKNKKPVLKFTIEGEFVCEYGSTVEAADKNNCVASSITNCCKKRYKSVGGFVYRFKKITKSHNPNK